MGGSRPRDRSAAKGRSGARAEARRRRPPRRIAAPAGIIESRPTGRAGLQMFRLAPFPLAGKVAASREPETMSWAHACVRGNGDRRLGLLDQGHTSVTNHCRPPPARAHHATEHALNCLNATAGASAPPAPRGDLLRGRGTQRGVPTKGRTSAGDAGRDRRRGRTTSSRGKETPEVLLRGRRPALPPT